jgi:hypothetical protein
MRKIIWAFVVMLAACTYVPPEAVSPVAEVCIKHGMEVRVMPTQISCYKKED